MTLPRPLEEPPSGENVPSPPLANPWGRGEGGEEGVPHLIQSRSHSRSCLSSLVRSVAYFRVEESRRKQSRTARSKRYILLLSSYPILSETPRTLCKITTDLHRCPFMYLMIKFIGAFPVSISMGNTQKGSRQSLPIAAI